MKKKEWIILSVAVIIAIAGILVFKLTKKSEPEVLVDVYHRDKIVESFDPSVDATYTIEGDYGTLDVVVKDGKWEVDNEQCPNHICHGMGWVGVDEYMPITCIPNNVVIIQRSND